MRIKTRLSMAMNIGLACMLGSLVASPVFADLDVPVETEAEYVALLDAIRAAEYTRQGYLEDDANPRAVAAIVALWAFADRNPLATPEQFDAFVIAYDAALASAVPGDGRLVSAGSMLTALNAAVVPSDGVLVGTDTRVGRDAMALLGVALPGLESFEQSQQRMARFDVGSVQRWINRSQTADALTGVLAGVSPSGDRIDGLALAGAMYVESMGYAPMLGMVDPNQVEVNAGLSGLPDFAGFVAIRDDAGAHVGLEAEVFAEIADIQTDAGLILDSIGQAEVPSGLALDSVDLFAAVADPNDPDHAAAVAFLEARRQAVVDSIRETSDERASVFARTLLLQQSSYPDVAYVAENTRSFAGLQLQVNNELAVAQQSLGIVGSLAELGAAYATGNVFAGVTSTAGVISGVLGLVDLLGVGPPSADQQIFDQIAGLRQQVADLQVQMNERFDIVDAKLDAIFTTMVAAFDLLQNGVDTLIADLATVRGALDRIEVALFGFAQNLLLVDLTTQTDAVLDYRAKTGFDLSYTDQSPSFVGAASGLTTFATFTAQTSVFAGPEENQSMTLTLDNASDVLLGENDVVSRLLNDFRRVPAGLVTSGGDPVVGPIVTGRTAAPAPWSQAAAAYTQLSRESPWYFAYMLQSQQASGGGNQPQIEQIIDQGERIALLASATRGRDDLFNALLQRASDEMVQTQAAINDLIDEELTDRGFMNSGARVDPWGPLGQAASPLIDAIVDVNLDGFVGPFRARLELISLSDRGYEMSVSDNAVGTSAASTRDELIGRNVLDRLIRGTTSRPLVVLEDDNAVMSPGSSNEFTMEIFIRLDGLNQSVRTIRVVAEVLDDQFGQGQWGPPVNTVNNGGVWSQMAELAWISFSGGNFQFTMPLGQGDLVGQIFPVQGVTLNSPFPNGFFYEVDARLRVISDTSTYNSAGADYYNVQTQLLTNAFSDLRSGVRSKVFADLGGPSTPLGVAARGLDNASALLDGYLTLGASDAMNRGEALRSAFRGVPSVDGLGFRSGDLLEVLLAESDGDDGSLGGTPGISLPAVDASFSDRIAALGSEVALAISNDAPSFPYVEFMLADLRALRDNAFGLATDDTYSVAGSASFDAAAGLMANDIGQPGRIDNQDLMVDLDYFGSPGQVGPTNGTVSVDPDGSFVYTPDAGFEGTDSFTYRLIAQVGDPANPIGDPNVASDPATVVLRVTAADCAADITGDGVLNFFDVSGFIGLYVAEDPAADLTGDGLFNFFDVSAYIGLFNAGCP